MATDLDYTAYRLIRLVQRSQTTGTQVHSAHLTADSDLHTLNIRAELTSSCSFRVTNIVPKLGPFAANLTFGHVITSLISRA